MWVYVNLYVSLYKRAVINVRHLMQNTRENEVLSEVCNRCGKAFLHLSQGDEVYNTISRVFKKSNLHMQFE